MDLGKYVHHSVVLQGIMDLSMPHNLLLVPVWQDTP